MTQKATANAQSEGLGTTIGRVAGILGSDEFPTGERAALKRLDPTGPPSLPFYRFAFRHLPNGWESRTAAWMTLIAGIALMYPHPHRPARPTGQALAESGYAETRLERLLATEGDTLYTLLLRAARFLAAKGESCNWLDFARLVLARDHDKRQAARLAIARSYYRNLQD